MAYLRIVRTHLMCYPHSLYLGASLTEAYLYGLHAQHMCQTSTCTFYSPLYASIWLKFWPSWVAWLLYLCPTFPLVRLGHKGSTSAIVTAGSAGCVPQTGWSRKLAFLREYSVGDLKDDFLPIYLSAPRCFPALFAVRTCTLGHASQGKEPLTELFSLEDVSYYPCNIT